MRKRKLAAVLVSLALTISTQGAYATGSTSTGAGNVSYYSIQMGSGNVISEGTTHTPQVFPGVGTTQNFYVDGKMNTIKIVSATLNQQKTQNTPYTGLKRVCSLANGQTSTLSKSSSVNTVYSTKNIHSSSNTYSFGVSTDTNKNLLGKVLSCFVSSKISSNISFQNSYSTTDKTTLLKGITSSISENYSVPALSTYLNSNSADFYAVTNYDVYDIVAELTEPEKYSSNPATGMVSAKEVNITKIPTPDGKLEYRCSQCNAHIFQGECIPFNKVMHVVFGDGHFEHYEKIAYYDAGIKQYDPNYSPKNTVTFEFNWPVIEKFHTPWQLNGQNTLSLSKPLHMAVPGSQEIIYYNGMPYILRHVQSPLLNISDSLVIPGEFIDSVTNGYSMTKKIEQTISLSSEAENTTTAGRTFDLSLETNIKNYITFSCGYKNEYSVTNTTSSSTTNSETISETNTYTMPSSFIQNGYDGDSIFLTKDCVAYQVTAEIVPILANGTPDEANKGTISYVHKEQFPRSYCKPYKVYAP